MNASNTGFFRIVNARVGIAALFQFFDPLRAALLQFPKAGAEIRLHTRVRTNDAARPILERASREGSLVVFTIVSPELREYNVSGKSGGLKACLDACVHPTTENAQSS